MIASRLTEINARIDAACHRCGRKRTDVRLVAVSKTVESAAMQEALTAGCRIFGESYIQEAQAKFKVLGATPLVWHLIGRLQRNKAKYAVRLFDLIHSLDSHKLAEELDRQAARVGKTQAVLLQINPAGELSKGGIPPEEALRLAQTLADLPHLQLAGLMIIPPYSDEAESSRPYFSSLYQLFRQLRDQVADPGSFSEISMGMSHDFEVAIEEGATLVRVGTAIFGERT